MEADWGVEDVAYIDFMRYEPDNNIPTAFLSKVIRNSNDNIVGVFIVHLDYQQISNVVGGTGKFW